MDVNNRKWRPTHCTRSNSAALLNDPKCIMPYTMTKSPFYKSALPHKSAGIDVDTAAALHKRVLDVTAVQKNSARQEGGDEVGIRHRTVVTGHHTEIATILDDLGVVRRAQMTEIVECRMVKIRQKIKAEFSKTFAKKF